MERLELEAIGVIHSEHHEPSRRLSSRSAPRAAPAAWRSSRSTPKD